MKKGFTNKENISNFSFGNISKALEKSDLKTIFKKFQDKLDFDLIAYKKTLISNFNEFQREVKDLSEILKEKLAKSSETYKAIINEEHINVNPENIIQLFLAQCELIKNVYNEQYNLMREQRIPKLQADSDKILKSIDELAITYEDELKSFISIESKEYKINIIEPLAKFKDEMNSFLIHLIKKIKNIMNSSRNTFLSMIVSFEYGMNDYIRFGNRKNIQNNKYKT